MFEASRDSCGVWQLETKREEESCETREQQSQCYSVCHGDGGLTACFLNLSKTKKHYASGNVGVASDVSLWCFTRFSICLCAALASSFRNLRVN